MPPKTKDSTATKVKAKVKTTPVVKKSTSNTENTSKDTVDDESKQDNVDDESKEDNVDEESKEGDKRNKKTQKADLVFNVLSFDKFIKEHFVSKNYNTPRMASGGAGLAAINEMILDEIVKLAMEKAVKDSTTGLLLISRENILTALSENTDLKRYFHGLSLIYDSKISYSKLYPVNGSVVQGFIDDKHSKLVKFVNNSFDFLMYLLYRMSIDIIDTCNYMLEWSGKKLLEAKCIKYSLCSKLDGGLCNRLVIKLDEIHKLFKTEREVKENADTSDEKDDENKADDINKIDVKETPVKVSTKKTADVKKTSSVEVRDGKDDDSDEDDDNDADDDEEVEKDEDEDEDEDKDEDEDEEEAEEEVPVVVSKKIVKGKSSAPVESTKTSPKGKVKK